MGFNLRLRVLRTFAALYNKIRKFPIEIDNHLQLRHTASYHSYQSIHPPQFSFIKKIHPYSRLCCVYMCRNMTTWTFHFRVMRRKRSDRKLSCTWERWAMDSLPIIHILSKSLFISPTCKMKYDDEYYKISTARCKSGCGSKEVCEMGNLPFRYYYIRGVIQHVFRYSARFFTLPVIPFIFVNIRFFEKYV